jgi:hypothetical protein
MKLREYIGLFLLIVIGTPIYFIILVIFSVFDRDSFYKK